jgi:hypothetical protein
MDLMQILMDKLSGGAVSQISRQIGTDEQTTNSAVNAAIPVLISAMAGNAAQRGGAESLNNALQQHDGSVLDDVSGYFNAGGNTDDGAGILGHVFGNRQNAVQDALSQKTGLDTGSIARILMMVAPLVMGALGKAQRSTGLDADRLGPYLQQQRQQAQAASPDIMSTLSGLLDSNKDGSILDELGRLAGDFFGKK